DADIVEAPARLAIGAASSFGIMLASQELEQAVVERLDAERDLVDAGVAQSLQPQALRIALDRDLLRASAHGADDPSEVIRAEQRRRSASEIERPGARFRPLDLAADLVRESVVE